MLQLATVLVCLLLGALSGVPSARAQDTPPDDSKLEFYSGNVVEFSETNLVVSRSLLGKESEKRSFRMTTDTKVEGKLKVKARVTVGFTSTDDADVAVRIIVRDQHKGNNNK